MLISNFMTTQNGIQGLKSSELIEDNTRIIFLEK